MKGLKHIIKIDEYMEVSISIPEILDVLEFKALTSKVNKLFNMAEVPLKANSMAVREYNILTIEQEQQLIKEYKQADTTEKKDELAKKYNYKNRSSLYAKVKYLRDKSNKNSDKNKVKPNKNSLSKKDMDDKIIELLKRGYTYQKAGDELGVKWYQVRDRFKILKRGKK